MDNLNRDLRELFAIMFFAMAMVLGIMLMLVAFVYTWASLAASELLAGATVILLATVGTYTVSRWAFMGIDRHLARKYGPS